MDNDTKNAIETENTKILREPGIKSHSKYIYY